MFDERYDGDPVARMKQQRRISAPERIVIKRGMWLEELGTSFYGRVAGATRATVILEDVDGAKRQFPLDGRFLKDDAVVELALPATSAGAGKARSASGSFHVANAPAKVAKHSRIFVEGRHDAELVEQVWGHDLRVEGVVVEYLEGADHLAEALTEFRPTAERRVGVLLDHLVTGTKEDRIAQAAAAPFAADSVLITGHPYIDIWEAVKPARLGLESWPRIPRGQDWKTGICRSLSWPADNQEDIANAWQRIRERVRDYRDLEPALVGRVEELIDFVTAAGSA